MVLHTWCYINVPIFIFVVDLFSLHISISIQDNNFVDLRIRRDGEFLRFKGNVNENCFYFRLSIRVLIMNNVKRHDFLNYQDPASLCTNISM